MNALVGDKRLDASVGDKVADWSDQSCGSRGFPSGDATIIIPALNERAGIGKVLSRIPRGIVKEIIVVDSSNDGTGEIARNHGARVIREDRKGYGRALQTGIDNATGKIVAYIDADVTYDPQELPRLIDPILRGQFDVVLGSRLNGDLGPGAMKPLNRVGNSLISLAFSLVCQKRISDSQCGARAIRKALLEDLYCEEEGMPYVTEQLLKLAKKGARIGEAPISYRRRVGETKLVPWKDGLQILRTIFKDLITQKQ